MQNAATFFCFRTYILVPDVQPISILYPGVMLFENLSSVSPYLGIGSAIARLNPESHFSAE